MLKKILIIALSINGISMAKAQEVVFNWGTESKNDLTYYAYLKGADDEVLKLSFQQKGSSIIPYIFRYDDNLTEQDYNTISVSEKGIKFDRLISVKNNLLLFTNKYDNSTKATSFYCQPYNIRTLGLLGPNQHLGAFGANKKTEQSSADYTLSQDSTKILMMGLSPYSKSENEKYYMGVYSPEMEKLWENTVELPYKDKFVKILSNIVTNDGKVGVLMKHYNNNELDEYIKKDGNRIPSYSVKLLLYAKGNNQPHEYVFDTGKFIHSINIAAEDNNQIELFGLCQNNWDGLITSYFITKIDKVTGKTTNTIADFPDSFIAQLEVDDQGKASKKEGGLSNSFRFADYVKRKDGSKDYLLEYREVTGTGYKFGNVIDINPKSNGQTVISRIPKMQLVPYSFRSLAGFRTLPYKNGLVVFYNDNERNLKRETSKKPDEIKFGLFGNPTLAMATVDENGNVSRASIINKQKNRFIVAPNASFKLSDNRIALYAIKEATGFSTRDMIGVLTVK